MDEPAGASPRNRVRRIARLAAVPVGHAGRTAFGLGKRVGGQPGEAVAAQIQQRTAQQLFATLGELKGGAMKVGQAMSAMEAALPEQLAGPYRDALVKLQDGAPAMPASLVDSQLDRAFPAGWRRMFREFDHRPVAAASVGQVHRAVWQDGTPVAVKIQYPGAGDALVADMSMLEKLAPLIRTAMPGIDAKALLTELRERLVDEVDYVLEADAQMAFYEAFRDDADFFVPDVLVVEDHVLISRWCDGTPLSRIITTGHPDERDRAGLLLVRLLFSSLAAAGRLHGDPHPGNFRLLDDGRLAVLDFGSTEPMPRGWTAKLGPLLRAGRDRNADGLFELADATGVVRSGKVTPAALLDLLDPYLEPLRVPQYQFTRAWMQHQTRRSTDPLSSSSRTQRQLTVPPRHLLTQRVAAGLAGVLCSLGARVAVDAEARRWLPGYA